MHTGRVMETSPAAPADFCFVHFTNTHIMAGGVHPATQVDTAACLRQVIGVLNALEPHPAFAVIGGDLEAVWKQSLYKTRP
jgi:hypothetical protein